MNKVKFLSILKNKIKLLLKTGERQYFYSYESPDSKKFRDYIEESIRRRPDYKGFSWFDYDIEEFYIELNDLLPDDIKSLFSLNLIVDYISDLNYNEFELVCIVLMQKMLGSTLKCELKSSRDEGIDFYGRYNAKDDSESSFFNISAWYIGQAKYYEENSIKTNLIRELIGTVELAKNKIWAIDGNYKNIDINKSDHIIPVFITSSRYSQDSYQISEKYSIKLLDEIDLIFWLSIKFKGDIKLIKQAILDLKK